ncbi:uncharacterized protein cubi_03042 [Cryptosporidium ubiquitum]|uniref:Uncharacterized protein n=1 Tax=Cryptosporidium ubiquitum TaxID=857276 RepID=A0A1J4MLJ4_9CRYT|nr:uncharacterized protein cubi_03042 [Cryptosporidium ubiquitum]OII74911.1 hypothetical protein cubi_03042 [Cryptosporidium ubiquitum]
MVNINELNLLSVEFNAVSAINNLESVFLPKHTQSLDNISKAALLLPFTIQKELKLFDKCSISSENIDNTNLDKNEISAERQLNAIRNIEYKLNLKKKFSDKKKRLNYVSNILTDKFSIQNRFFFNTKKKEKNKFYDYLNGEEVSISNHLF